MLGTVVGDVKPFCGRKAFRLLRNDPRIFRETASNSMVNANTYRYIDSQVVVRECSFLADHEANSALREESLSNLLGEKRLRYRGHSFMGECGVTEAGRQLQSGYVSSKTFIHGECGVTEAGRQLQSGYVSSKTFIHGECGVTEAGRQLQSGFSLGHLLCVHSACESRVLHFVHSVPSGVFLNVFTPPASRVFFVFTPPGSRAFFIFTPRSSPVFFNVSAFPSSTTKGLARCSHNEIVASMQPQRACSFDVATTRLLPRCSHNEGFGSMQPQRDCCLDAATTKGLARCSHNEIVASMQPQRACSFDVATTRLLPRCSHNELAPSM
ncbi:hypothetical protein O3P69_009059 [Scylla paramamosain]|uniref:Uncharacterized protein n=1 Tax=Scylla paramamosain TaxID=85552 RepID=A0AAW0TU36_SCYPA